MPRRKQPDPENDYSIRVNNGKWKTSRYGESKINDELIKFSAWMPIEIKKNL